MRPYAAVHPVRPWCGPHLLRAHGLAEIAMMMAAVIGIRVGLDLLLGPANGAGGYDDPLRQALAIGGMMLHWVPAGMLMTVAARLCLDVRMTDAGVVAALALVGLWLAPVLVRIAGVPADMHLAPVGFAVALAGVLAAGWCTRAPFLRLMVFGLSAAVIVLVDAHWSNAHAWILDIAGLSVRGALLPGVSPPQRAVYDMTPFVLLALLALLAVGRPDRAFRHGAMTRFFGPVMGSFAVLAVAWGFMMAARATGYELAAFHPPVVYAPVMGLICLWMIATAVALIAWRHRRHDQTVAGVDCLALLVLAGLLAAPLGVWFLLVAGFLTFLGLLASWPLGAPRLPRWAAPILGGLAALSLYGAGYAAVPGIDPGEFIARPLVLAGLFAAGASVAAIAVMVGAPGSDRRWGDQIWLADLVIALLVVFLASDVSDSMVWVGIALTWVALAIVAYRPTPTTEPGQRLLVHALPFCWALTVLAILGLLAPRVS